MLIREQHEVGGTKMKLCRYIGAFIILFGPLISQEVPTLADQVLYITPIQILTTSAAPKDLVWVHATVINIDEEDTPVIQDKTGKITLFLPTDELLALKIPINCELYIQGRVDISSVHPSKNEFDAERIIFADSQP